MALIGEMQYLTIGGNTYSIPTSGGSTVTIERALTSGTKSATISVDGTSYDLYAPTNTDTKLQIEAVSTNTTYYPIIGSGTTAAIRQYDSEFNYIHKTNNDEAVLSIGSTIRGKLQLRDITGGIITLYSQGAEIDSSINLMTLETVVNTISTSAGAHTAISYNSGAVSFNVPTKTSHLTNDSGFITTPNVIYCTCDTAAATAAKVATVVSGSLASLNAGDQAIVKFTNANGVASPTLQIGSLTAKSIKRYGTTAPSTSATTSWQAGSCILFVYDGTYWQMCDWTNTNTTYSALSEADMQAGTATTARLITAARLKEAVEYHAPVTSVNGATGAVTISVPTKTSDLTNDSGFITGYTETDPTVPSWAKEATKPTYTYSEVGAAASSHTHGNITNGGDITATAPTIANGDQIIINDNSVSKITNGPTFDGSTTTKALTPKGTWETFLQSFTETDPVFSASVAAGITSTDISNWNAKVSDDHKWNDVSLTHSLNVSNNDFYVPMINTVDGTAAIFNRVSNTPMNYAIAKYGTGAYLYSTTPSANDNSTKVATTAYVDAAISGAGGGTVTSVGLSNATNGGLSISGSPITSSGSITVGHSNVLTSAQTTSGIYPIKIDKNGHISEYGSAVSIPTKTSDLTNDSGFVTTDEKLKTEVQTAYETYFPVLGSNSTTASTKFYSPYHRFYYDSSWAHLEVGDNNRTGNLKLSRGNYSNSLFTESLTADRQIKFPNKDGTVALTSDIPSVPSWALQSTKPTYTASEVGALPSTTSIPSATSDLTNDSGFITANDVPTEVFIATYDTTTSAEIEAAYQAGKAIFVSKGALMYPFTSKLSSGSASIYGFTKVELNILSTIQCSNDTWTTTATVLVPSSRTINSKALSSNITLTPSDIGIHTSTSDPTSADGNDGDVWLVYSVPESEE